MEYTYVNQLKVEISEKHYKKAIKNSYCPSSVAVIEPDGSTYVGPWGAYYPEGTVIVGYTPASDEKGFVLTTKMHKSIYYDNKGDESVIREDILRFWR